MTQAIGRSFEGCGCWLTIEHNLGSEEASRICWRFIREDLAGLQLPGIPSGFQRALTYNSIFLARHCPRGFPECFRAIRSRRPHWWGRTVRHLAFQRLVERFA